jgi:hypothetical protein
MLDVFIKRVADRRDLGSPAKLSKRLAEVDEPTSIQTVCWWFDGTTKRLDSRKARALRRALDLDEDEWRELQVIQAGLEEDAA